MDRLRALLIDDDEKSYRVARAFLGHARAEIALDWVATWDEGLAAIERGDHDVYLIDYRLGDRNGLDLLRESLARGCRAPLIMLTAEGGDRLDVEAMRLGAADYLDKAHLDRPLLERAIRYASERARRRRLEEQLQQSQKIETIGRLAGGVAHDFNNLLTAILGYTELLMDQLGAEHRLARDLEEIRKAGERAAALTHQLLAFSRKQVMRPEVLRLNSVVANMDKMLRRLIREDIQLRTRLEPSLASARIDPGQLEQVILNLAVNARDALPQGGCLTIETANFEANETYVRAHEPMQSGRYVTLRVSDNGAGMDAETRSHLFEPFFTTKERGKGTGLGLATVYGIVKQSGGFIWVESEPGRGTTFTIHLPAVDEEPELALPAPAAIAVPRGSETVLLVEDEEAVRSLARDVLLRNGYTVLEAPSPRRAQAITREYRGPIDLLVTDVVMPEMNGPDLAHQLTVARPDLKVLFMSGYTDGFAIYSGRRTRNMAFLQKPFMADTLARKVRELLEGSAPASDAAMPASS